MYILSNKQTGKSLKGIHHNSRVAKKNYRCQKFIRRLRTNMSVPSVITNIIKRKIGEIHMIGNHKSPSEERERSGVPVR